MGKCRGGVYLLSPNVPRQILVENVGRSSIFIQNVGATDVTIASDGAPAPGQGIALDPATSAGGQGGIWEVIGGSYCPGIAAPIPGTCPANAFFAVSGGGSVLYVMETD